MHQPLSKLCKVSKECQGERVLTAGSYKNIKIFPRTPTPEFQIGNMVVARQFSNRNEVLLTLTRFSQITSFCCLLHIYFMVLSLYFLFLCIICVRIRVYTYNIFYTSCFTFKLTRDV